MLNRKKTILLKVLVLPVLTLSLTGCFETMKEKYNEGAAATSSVVNTTKKLFGGNSNSQQAQKPASQQSAQAGNRPIKKPHKTSLQLKREEEEAKFSHITFESPEPNSIKSVKFRSYKGLFLSDIPNYSGKEQVPSYYEFISLKHAASQLNKEKVKKGYNGKRFVAKSPAQWREKAWFEMLTQVAGKALAFDKYKEYMCITDREVLLNSCKGSYMQGKGHWVITGTVFQKRKAFGNFVDNEADKILEMAKNASDEIYLSGEARVSPYQFDAGGFIIKNIRPKFFYPPGGDGLDNVKNLPIFTAQRFGSGKPHTQIAGKLLKMDASKAESYTKTLKQYNNQLYYVYKVKVNVHKQSYIEKSKALRVNAMKFTHDVLSNKMEFFYDRALTKKAFDMPIR